MTEALCGDTALVETGTAEMRSLDESNRLAEARSIDGGLVSAGGVRKGFEKRFKSGNSFQIFPE